MVEEKIETVPPSWDSSFPDDRFAHLVGSVSRAFARALQTRLDAHEMPISYWKYLRVLWREDGITQQELSVRAGLTPAMTSGAIKGMSTLELVVWAKLPSNKKNSYIYLTPKGRALKAQLIPIAEVVNAVGLKGVDEQDLETARKVMVAVFRNLDLDEQGGSPTQLPRSSARAIVRATSRRST